LLDVDIYVIGEDNHRALIYSVEDDYMCDLATDTQFADTVDFDYC